MRAVAAIGFILALLAQPGAAQVTWRQIAGPNGGAVLSQSGGPSGTASPGGSPRTGSAVD